MSRRPLQNQPEPTEKGHPSDVNVGRATICFNEEKRIWVAPGGGFIFTAKRAYQVCEKIADFMDKAQ